MPELGPGQVRVKVECCGLCHTDIHAANGDWPIKPSPPFIPGHEGVGIVTELAPGEHAVGDLTHKIAVGDRVAMPWLGYACGCCNYCADGWETAVPRAGDDGLLDQRRLGRVRGRVRPLRRQGP